MNLGINGQSVTEIQLGYQVSLDFSDGHNVQIENDFAHINKTGKFDISLRNGISETDAKQISLLRGSVVTTATVSDSGALELKFDDGSEITVQPDPDYDAWSFSGPHGTEIVCMVGGNVTTFGDASSTPTA